LALQAALCLTGCFDAASGGNESQTQALRAAASHPACVEPPLLLVLDEDAVDKGREPNRFSAADVNDDIASPGQRRALRAFEGAQGRELVLPSGEVGDEGWFALKTARVAWRAAGPDSSDGLRNFLEAGPGLGTPDAKGNRESLLEMVPNLTPLRATGLAALAGKSVCAVVLDGDARVHSYTPLKGSLAGDALGRVAFQVLYLSGPSGGGRSASRLPDVKIRVLDAGTVCEDDLAPFLAAPAPVSYCEPRDVEPPACAGIDTLLDETWDIYDPERWDGDGEGLVEGGFFSAKPGANSSLADWIRPCPVPVESTGSVRFANRLQFVQPAENDFAETGALFFVNAGEAGAFDNYAFVNVGYTLMPSRIFVEIFGSDGGREFDQFMESSLAYRQTIVFNLELWIDRNAYRIAVAGEAIDTVSLANPVKNLSLFEVGVQQNAGGLRGFIDRTTITSLCEADSKHRPRKRERCKPRSRCLPRAQASRNGGHAKADHSRCHHARSGAERYAGGAIRGGDSGGGSGSGSGEGSGTVSGAGLARTSAWTPVPPNPCGKNQLIRRARAKVRLMEDPPMGLLILSRMKEEPGCGD
jgi:hypothetical protein